MKTLMCPKCKIPEEVENMFNKEDCTSIIYNQARWDENLKQKN